MNAYENLKATDYIVAVGKIVKATDIIFVSKILNGRMCIYLKNKTVVYNIIGNIIL